MQDTYEKFTWSSTYEVGIEPIDTEHKTLFILYNDLVAALARPVSPTMKHQFLITVQRHLVAHFASEEVLLRNCRHPMAEEHAAEHRQAERALSQLVEDPESMESIFSLAGVLRGYINHILIEDRRVFTMAKSPPMPIVSTK